jgi:hypothetical protein
LIPSYSLIPWPTLISGWQKAENNSKVQAAEKTRKNMGTGISDLEVLNSTRRHLASLVMLNTMDPVSSPVISRYANTFQGC